MISFFFVHYLHRTFIFPFKIANTKKMPFEILIMGCLFCTINALMQTRSVFLFCNYSWETLNIPMFFIGLCLFFLGMYINIYHDYLMISLKKNSNGYIFRVFHYESVTEITKENSFYHLATISAEKTFDEMINNRNYSVVMEQFLKKERDEINRQNNRIRENNRNRENRRDNYEYSYAIGCFDENETRVYILEDGIRKRIYLKDLKRGDIVLETDSKRRGIRKRFKIVHIMKSLCPKDSYLAKYQNIISTPWHPIQINGVYKPSIYDSTTTRIKLERDTYVISFSAVEISNTGETIGFADGIPLINGNKGIIYGATFGHGNKTKELFHPFWGKQLLEIFDALDSEYPYNNGKFEVKLRNINNIYSIFYNSKEYAYA